MPETDVWTIGRLLEWTTGYLKQHGSDSPRLDAEVLLAAARGCERIELYTAFGQVPADDVRDKFRGWVKQRAQGMPVAYLVGHREFYSLPFQVTPAVLIPRPETEFVVLTLLDLIKNYRAAAGRPVEIADIGTGSGAIAVCAARMTSHARVMALDISGEALDVARLNVQEHRLADRIELVQSDLFAEVAPAQRFDFVVSNPPYLTQQEVDSADRDVKEHEPRQALLGGPTGIEVIARLIPQAPAHLKTGGWLVMEISPTIQQAVRDLLESDGRFTNVEITNDLARLARVIRARRID